MELVQRREIFHQWHIYASLNENENRKSFILPQLDVQEHPKMICRNAVASLLNMGIRMIKSSIQNPNKAHGNIGKSNRCADKEKWDEIHESLHKFFTELRGKNYCTNFMISFITTTSNFDMIMTSWKYYFL